MPLKIPDVPERRDWQKAKAKAEGEIKPKGKLPTPKFDLGPTLDSLSKRVSSAKKHYLEFKKELGGSQKDAETIQKAVKEYENIIKVSNFMLDPNDSNVPKARKTLLETLDKIVKATQEVMDAVKQAQNL